MAEVQQQYTITRGKQNIEKALRKTMNNLH